MSMANRSKYIMDLIGCREEEGEEDGRCTCGQLVPM